jgi:hypothetical protein
MKKGLSSLIIEEYFELDKNFGPHSLQILKELKSVINNQNSLSVIIISATLIDVIKNEQSKLLNRLSGIEINSIFSSRQISWLRARRNSIVHHEGPTDGLLGGEKEEKVLLLDANKSVQIINNFLKDLLS